MNTLLVLCSDMATGRVLPKKKEASGEAGKELAPRRSKVISHSP
jgi:hypothetical protein